MACGTAGCWNRDQGRRRNAQGPVGFAGRGKSGGIRVIYFWRVNEAQILLLTLYAKNERTDLSDAQVRQLAKYVKALK